jgi:tetratricopeptide (TPR) repeat protein
MAHDLEAAGDKNGARKTRERLVETDLGSQPAATAAPAPKRGDLVFLDTGLDLPTSPSRGQAYSRTTREPPRPIEEPPAEPIEESPSSAQDEPSPPEGLVARENLPGVSSSAVDELIIDPLLSASAEGAADDSVLGIERLGEPIGPVADLIPPLDIQRGSESSSLDFQPTMLEGMEGTSLGELSTNQTDSLDFSVESESSPLDIPDDLIISLPDTETGFNIEAELAPESPTSPSDLPLVTPEPRASDTLADLENRVLDDPENPDVHLQLADRLLSMGETERVAEELELALAGFEDRQDWTRASQMADRLVELAPESITHHQKRVELAYRMGDRVPLLEAYLGLGDALAQSGSLDKAAAVYGRVIEHDPGNARAAAALARVGGGQPATPPKKAASPPPAAPAPVPLTKASAPPKPEPKASSPPPKPAPEAVPVQSTPPRKPEPARASSDEGFIDLGSMLRDERGQRDTRMRVNRREPKDQDEQREFHEILEQFKRGIDENLDSDDYQAHYDLGVAFKEMGLLDEAIAEFQKALRASEGRLRTSEALGMAFFEKGQYAVCESVLRRAVDGLDGTDEAKIGLLYWLGRASEALGKKAEAMASYERAVAVDIRFMDLSQRIQRLAPGRRS